VLKHAKTIVLSMFSLYASHVKRSYTVPNIIMIITSRRLRWVGHIARIRQKMGASRVLVVRPRIRWLDNSKMDFKEVQWAGVH
jgi:hypothetical protein